MRLAVRIRCGGRRGRCRLHLADVSLFQPRPGRPPSRGYAVVTSQVMRDRGFPNLQDFVPRDFSGSIWFPGCAAHDQLLGDEERPTQSGEPVQMPCSLLRSPVELFRRTGQTEDVLWTPTAETVVVVDPDPVEDERRRQAHYRMLADKESRRRRRRAAGPPGVSGVRSPLTHNP